MTDERGVLTLSRKVGSKAENGVVFELIDGTTVDVYPCRRKGNEVRLRMVADKEIRIWRKEEWDEEVLARTSRPRPLSGDESDDK